MPTPSQRVDDNISGGAAMADGSVWESSFGRGLAHIDAGGQVVARLTSADGLIANGLSAAWADPADQSVWTGANFGGGLSRLKGGGFQQYGAQIFGDEIANQGVTDIQAWGSGGGRKIIVSFGGTTTTAGVVAVYTGP
jgi:hypothetical protein